jgi:hypothetical protein
MLCDNPLELTCECMCVRVCARARARLGVSACVRTEGTFSVKKTSPAVAKLGFVPIDISKVGPRAGSVGVAVRAPHCPLPSHLLTQTDQSSRRRGARQSRLGWHEMTMLPTCCWLVWWCNADPWQMMQKKAS